MYLLTIFIYAPIDGRVSVAKIVCNAAKVGSWEQNVGDTNPNRGNETGCAIARHLHFSCFGYQFLV
jgi:hypothetical protein